MIRKNFPAPWCTYLTVSLNRTCYLVSHGILRFREIQIYLLQSSRDNVAAPPDKNARDSLQLSVRFTVSEVPDRSKKVFASFMFEYSTDILLVLTFTFKFWATLSIFG